MSLPPEARIHMEGKTYGGAYWEVAEFEVVLTALSEDVWRVELQDAGGHAVHTLPLTIPHAAQVVAVATAAVSGPYSVPGLEQRLVWSLGDDDRNYVEITDFEEISAWLIHFLDASWPDDVPEWEF